LLAVPDSFGGVWSEEEGVVMSLEKPKRFTLIDDMLSININPTIAAVHNTLKADRQEPQV